MTREELYAALSDRDETSFKALHLCVPYDDPEEKEAIEYIKWMGREFDRGHRAISAELRECRARFKEKYGHDPRGT